MSYGFSRLKLTHHSVDLLAMLEWISIDRWFVCPRKADTHRQPSSDLDAHHFIHT